MHSFQSHRGDRAARSPDWRGHSRHDFVRHVFERHAMGRHGRRGRVFEQGDLRYVLLQLIADKPSHGYELIKDIEERLGGAYSPSPGVIYPTLTLLEELGYIRAVQSDGARKAFEITEEGRNALAENKATVDDIFQRISQVAERMGGRAPHQIVRPLENGRMYAAPAARALGKLTSTIRSPTLRPPSMRPPKPSIANEI